MTKIKRKINQIDLKNGEILETFASIKEASDKTGTSRLGIYRCAAGMQKKSGDFRWAYADIKEEKPDLPPPSDDDKGKMFFCQACGDETRPKHKFLICRVCIAKIVKTKGEGRFSDIVYLPVKKGVLSVTVEKALRAFAGER